jgi:hypothetical protein
MAYTKYSLTPANNTATPPDGAPEGMLPSAVNDTMRDMMAQIRDCGDGVRDGTYTMTAPKITGGTITGATLTGNTLTNPVITGGTLTSPVITGGPLIQNTSATLQINSTTAAQAAYLLLSNSTDSSNSYLYAINKQLGVVQSDTSASSYIYFSTQNIERARIDSSGNVGIGTSSPTVKLDINGSMNATDGLFGPSNYKIYIRNLSGINRLDSYNFPITAEVPITYNASLHNFSVSSADAMLIDASRIVTMYAYGAGTATFSSSGVISSVSDETWKTKDGVPVNPDAMLQKLEPGYWYYNEEKAPTFGQDRQLGFYAQNVNEAIGDEAAPTPEEGKPWGYYDRSVLAITVMSLKNALATIEELKQRITALENK